MKCEICGKGLAEGASLIRQNAKGVIGIWRCTTHNKKPVDDVTKVLLKGLKTWER